MLAVARGNIAILVNIVLRSTNVSKPPFVSGAGERIALPIANTGSAIDNRRALEYVDSMRDQATSGVGSRTFVVALAAPPQAPPQIAAVALVLPNHLVNALVAECDALLAEPAADLFRRPTLLAQTPFNGAAQSGCQLARFAPHRPPCFSFGLRLFEPVSALPTIATQFAAYRALADAEQFSNPLLAAAALVQNIYLTTIFMPDPPVLLHR
jgi:hypothetical protein